MGALSYTEEIFNILSRGGFISNNSISPKIRRIYDAIEDHLADYDEYFYGIGFHLEAGDGYSFLLARRLRLICSASWRRWANGLISSLS